MATTTISPPTPAEAKEATIRLLRAGWHPIQIRSLTILTERVASPKEIAIELGLTKAKAGYVSHHCKELLKVGLIELVKTEPRRGANEHFYRAVQALVITDEQAKKMSFEERLMFTCWIICRISHDFVRAVETGVIDERIDRHLTRYPLKVDEQAYREIVEEQNRTFYRIEEITAAAEERLAESGDEPMEVSAILGCFPMPNGLGPADQ